MCIVDEFGKGTLTTDGVGLLAASLHHFASMPVPPKLLACTHFSDLLNQPILRRWDLPQHCCHSLCVLDGLLGQLLHVKTHCLAWHHFLMDTYSVHCWRLAKLLYKTV